MKRLILFLCLASGLRAADTPVPPDRFNLIGEDYKHARELPPTLFNPFKSQASNAALARKETASVTDESVSDALTTRGLSGIVISPDAEANRVVVGDEVFGVGDELSFPDPKRPTLDPLVTGASVLLSAIRQENLEFEVRVEGEPPRHMTFPLHSFWTR